MSFRQGITNFGQRLADFAARFEKRRPFGGNATPRRGRSGRGFPTGLRELFTQGVTGEDFKRMVDGDAREAMRFYMREIDLEELKPHPWYRRYPMLAWRIFIALAYRLSPVRRITFAVATALFFFGWIQLLVLKAQAEGVRNNGGALWLPISFVLLLLVLLLELRDKLDLKGDLEVARNLTAIVFDKSSERYYAVDTGNSRLVSFNKTDSSEAGKLAPCSGKPIYLKRKAIKNIVQFQ